MRYFGFLFAAFTCLAVELHPPPEIALARVRRIYIENLGGGAVADQMRDMLIAALQASNLFVLTENPDRADATLRGSADEKIFDEVHSTSDSIGMHAGGSAGSSSHAYNSGVSGTHSLNAGISESESSRIQERRHEAGASVRLVSPDGDVIWSTTQESNGARFRSALADVADKIAHNLGEQARKARLAAEKQ
jgi:hypothetical protein